MFIKVTQLGAGYGKVPVLHDVDFQMEEGETVAIIGPNGAGKSTLLKTISGLVKPSSGSIEFNGKQIGGLSSDAVVREGLVYVPEGGRPFPNMSVYDNLLMGAFSNRKALSTGVLDAMYEVFPVLKARRDQLARTLSGGERQMLALARGLVSRPRLIMLDEPSLGLAPKLVDEIYEKIRALRQEFGLSVLLVEQNTSYALELADRGYVLENGHVALEGSSQFLNQSEHVKKAYLGL
ncbi:MAG: ABC transporter ATP-binding protein [Chloroflexi bacterium]|nr:ABC transporter ATP-binding protein [Chloroflexota bacterium]